MSWLDPKFKYRGPATHADPAAFARRMRARMRIADRLRTEMDKKVTAIRRTKREVA